MPKNKQTITKTEKELLTFIFLFQPVYKSLLRLIGNNYDFIGRKVSDLLSDNLIEYTKINPDYKRKELAIQLTEKGKNKILPYLQVSESFLTRNKNRIKGDENKYRQYKTATIISMFYPYIKDYISQFLSFENLIDYKQISIQEEMFNRSVSFPILFTNREIRDADEYNLKKITATRASGIAISQGKTFLLYNHNHKRMRERGNFEEKFKLYIEQITPNNTFSAIHFGRSFKPAIDSLFKTAIKQQEHFIMNKSFLEKHFYVPVTSTGSEQLQIYFMDNFREKIREALLTEEEILRAKNLPYDGESSDMEIIYLGFECDIAEIEKIMYLLQTIKRAFNIKIYCFNHQKQFYQAIFGSNAVICPLTIKEVTRVIK